MSGVMKTMDTMSVVMMSLIVLVMWVVAMMAPTRMAAMTTTSFSARKCRGASSRDAALASEGAPEAAARQRR